MRKHPEVDVVISFASLRSAFDSTMEVMQYSQVERGQTCKIVRVQAGIHFDIVCVRVLDPHHRHHSWRHSWSSDKKVNQGGWWERRHHYWPCYGMFLSFITPPALALQYSCVFWCVIWLWRWFLFLFSIFRWEASNQAALRSVTLAVCWTTSWLLNCIVLAVWPMCHDLGECPMN